MKESNEILNELASVSPTLAAINRVNIFRAPEGYFRDLSGRISTSIFLNQYPKKQAGNVPEGYFDSLSNQIFVRIKNEDAGAGTEEENMSPLLLSLKDKNVFNVPAGYFDTFSEQLLHKIKPESAKIISLSTKINWRRYAAAAVIAALISIGALHFFNNKDSSDNSTAQFSATDSESIPAYIRDARQYKTPELLDKGIASLSDEEIVTYLERHGNIMDDYLLTRDVDTQQLPEATEYLMDENTLNNFLNQIDARASNENNE